MMVCDLSGRAKSISGYLPDNKKLPWSSQSLCFQATLCANKKGFIVHGDQASIHHNAKKSERIGA